MASIEATCEASQHGKPQSSKLEIHSQESEYMREKRGGEEKATADRWAHTQDLPEMRRGILHPEPRCGTAVKKSPLARLGRCRTSLELGLCLIVREIVVGEKAHATQSEPNKGRVRSCAIWWGQRDLISHSLAHTMASVTWTAASHESLIGPPSELIHINDFLHSSGGSVANVPTAADLSEQSSEGIDPTLYGSIASECRWVCWTNDRTTHVEAIQV